MSVFQIQDWWSTRLGGFSDHETGEPIQEEFDPQGFLVAPIDNIEESGNKIVVGSLQGVLRIYHPKTSEFKVDDLIYEDKLEAPILQLLCGRFLPGSNNFGLAVLHPRKLVVYEVLPQSIKDNRASFYTLQKSYHHDLGVEGKHFTAYNMICGPFGQVKNIDLILVQSLDGKFQIFEQASHTLTRQLVNCFIPGPIIYVPKIDSFVLVTCNGTVECYRYQVLVSSQDDIITSSRVNPSSSSSTSSSSAANRLGMIRPILIEWSTELGEQCYNMYVGNFSSLNYSKKNPGEDLEFETGNEILMICERSIFLLKVESGRIIQQRRIEKGISGIGGGIMPSIPSSSRLSSISTSSVTCLSGVPSKFFVIDTDGTIFIYNEFNLVWASRPSHGMPVGMVVATIGENKGLIVSLDEDKNLSVGYLGTKPPSQAVLQTQRDLDYDKIDEEHKELLQIIRNSQSESHSIQSKNERIVMKVQQPKQFDTDFTSIPSGDDLNWNDFLKFPNSNQYVKSTLKLYISHTNDSGTSSPVLITPQVPSNIFVFPTKITLDKVNGIKSTPEIVKFHIFVNKDVDIPTSMSVSFLATYQNSRGEQQIVQHPTTLPLWMCCQVKPPLKSAMCKVILETSGPVIPLTDLFHDVLYAYQTLGVDFKEEGIAATAPQALGLDIFSLSSNSPLFENSSSSLLSHVFSSSSSIVSILVSKNSGRYRIQGDSYPLVFFIMQEVEVRLNKFLSSSSSSNPNEDPKKSIPFDFSPTISFSSSVQGPVSIVKSNEELPLAEYFTLIDILIKEREKHSKSNKILENLSQQYRLIEKRLLVRFKDKTPTPLAGLDILLDQTFQKIMDESEKIENGIKLMNSLSKGLTLYANGLVSLLGMKCGLTLGERMSLTSYFLPDSTVNLDDNWLELIVNSLNILLQTINRSARMGNQGVSTSQESFHRLISQLIERYEKGGRIFRDREKDKEKEHKERK